MDVSYPPQQQFEIGAISPSRRFLNNVFILYRQEFRRWFGITATTSLVAGVVLIIADQRLRAIFSVYPRGHIPTPTELLQAFVWRFGGFFLAWLLGAFALGAIATELSDKESETNEVWIHDSHQRSREHFGNLLVIALMTFCIFGVGMAAVAMVVLAIGKAVGWTHFARYNLLASLVGSVIVASLVSWFGIAIPLVLRGNIGAWAALKRSVRLSDGYEGSLFLLVIQSVVGSYLAWYAAVYGLALVVPPQLRFTSWYGWAVTLVAVLAAAAVEPPLFIGFSLLADETRSTAAHSAAP